MAHEPPTAHAVATGEAASTAGETLAERERAGADVERKYNKANAYVIANTVMRGALTAIYWLSPPQYPHAVFPTVARAEVWVKEKLAEAGVAL